MKNKLKNFHHIPTTPLPPTLPLTQTPNSLQWNSLQWRTPPHLGAVSSGGPYPPHLDTEHCSGSKHCSGILYR